MPPVTGNLLERAATPFVEALSSARGFAQQADEAIRFVDNVAGEYHFVGDIDVAMGHADDAVRVLRDSFNRGEAPIGASFNALTSDLRAGILALKSDRPTALRDAKFAFADAAEELANPTTIRNFDYRGIHAQPVEYLDYNPAADVAIRPAPAVAAAPSKIETGPIGGSGSSNALQLTIGGLLGTGAVLGGAYALGAFD